MKVSSNLETSFRNSVKDFRKQFKMKNKPTELPDNFYEDILELEIHLSQTLKGDDLEKLLQLYMVGIEYYEFKDLNKASGFQSRANNLLNKPEIVQILREQEDINQVKDTAEHESTNLRKTLKIRISLQKKLTMSHKENSFHKECDDIIQTVSTMNEDRVQMDNLIQKEYETQKNNLHERIKLRKSANLSKSLSNINLPTNQSTTEDNQQHSLFGINEINSTSSKSSKEHNQSFESGSSEGNNNNSVLPANLYFSLRETDSPRSPMKKMNKISNTVDIPNIINTYINNKSFGVKQKEILLSVKEKLDEYLFGYNEFFYEEHYKKVAKKIENLFEEKYRKYIEISKNYQDQIKETQYELINVGGLQDMQIDLILSSLEEEKTHELSKLNDEYDNLFKEQISSFKAVGFKQNNGGVLFLQEKTKLEIYNCLLSLFSS